MKIYYSRLLYYAQFDNIYVVNIVVDKGVNAYVDKIIKNKKFGCLFHGFIRILIENLC